MSIITIIYKGNIVNIYIIYITINPLENLSSRDRRKYIGQALYDIMRDMMFESSDYKETLFQSLINSGKLFGMNTKILEDIEGNEVTYRSMILKSFIRGDLIKEQTEIGGKRFATSWPCQKQ